MRLALVVPLQILGLLPKVMVGKAFTVTLIVLPVLEQPVVEFITLSVPVYVPAPGFDGAVSAIGDAGKLVLLKLVNPAMMAPADHAILY